MESLRNSDTASTLQTRDDFVADRLREAILHGHLKPGDKLDQNEIADLLSVSRSPVREALRTLAAEGLVEVFPHRGAVVAELMPEDLEEIYFIRGILEGMAARLAAPQLEPKRIATLESVLKELNKTTDLDAWLDLNRRFHHTIYQAAERPRLLSLIQSLRNTARPYIRQYIATEEHMEAARAAHRRIFDACEKRDGPRAQDETQKHLKAVCEGVLIHADSESKNLPLHWPHLESTV